jgi:hypothetical protein
MIGGEPKLHNPPPSAEEPVGDRGDSGRLWWPKKETLFFWKGPPPLPVFTGFAAHFRAAAWKRGYPRNSLRHPHNRLEGR